MNEADKTPFENHLLTNFFITMPISVNGPAYTALMSLSAALLCFSQNLAGCYNPYPQIEEELEETGCFSFVYARTYRQALVIFYVFLAHYVMRLLIIGLFIEREMMRKQGG